MIPDPIKSKFTVNQSNLNQKTKKYKNLFHINTLFLNFAYLKLS